MESPVASQKDAMKRLMPDLASVMDDAARKQEMMWTGMSPDSAVKGALSTGILSLDLLIGGGFAPGTVADILGDTGSCKSTLLYETFCDALARDIGVVFFDYESSTDPAYLKKMGISLGDVTGFRNKKGVWEQCPQLWYTSGSHLEGAFGVIHDILKAAPKKIRMEDNGNPRWFMIQADYIEKVRSGSWTDINKGLKAKMIEEVEDGKPAFLFAIDSAAAMVSKVNHEDPDREDVAQLARGLGKGFRLIKSLLAQRHSNLIFTNHITINPFARFANPETEPGGKAVMYYPDLKLRMKVSRTKTGTVEEPNVESNEGLDRYFAGSGYVQKNKRGASFRGMEFRNWSDAAGVPGRGICPVFDLYQFLVNTNQVELLDKGKEFKITVPTFDAEPMTWHAFKTFVLTEPRATTLVSTCRQQLRDGKAQVAFYEYLKDTPTATKKTKMFVATKGVSAEDSDSWEKQLATFAKADQAAVADFDEDDDALLDTKSL